MMTPFNDTYARSIKELKVKLDDFEDKVKIRDNLLDTSIVEIVNYETRDAQPWKVNFNEAVGNLHNLKTIINNLRNYINGNFIKYVLDSGADKATKAELIVLKPFYEKISQLVKEIDKFNNIFDKILNFDFEAELNNLKSLSPKDMYSKQFKNLTEKVNYFKDGAIIHDIINQFFAGVNFDNFNDSETLTELMKNIYEAEIEEKQRIDGLAAANKPKPEEQIELIKAEGLSYAQGEELMIPGNLLDNLKQLKSGFENFLRDIAEIHDDDINTPEGVMLYFKTKTKEILDNIKTFKTCLKPDKYDEDSCKDSYLKVVEILEMMYYNSTRVIPHVYYSLIYNDGGAKDEAAADRVFSNRAGPPLGILSSCKYEELKKAWCGSGRNEGTIRISWEQIITGRDDIRTIKDVADGNLPRDALPINVCLGDPLETIKKYGNEIEKRQQHVRDLIDKTRERKEQLIQSIIDTDQGLKEITRQSRNILGEPCVMEEDPDDLFKVDDKEIKVLYDQRSKKLDDLREILHNTNYDRSKTKFYDIILEEYKKFTRTKNERDKKYCGMNMEKVEQIINESVTSLDLEKAINDSLLLPEENLFRVFRIDPRNQDYNTDSIYRMKEIKDIHDRIIRSDNEKALRKDIEKFNIQIDAAHRSLNIEFDKKDHKRAAELMEESKKFYNMENYISELQHEINKLEAIERDATNWCRNKIDTGDAPKQDEIAYRKLIEELENIIDEAKEAKMEKDDFLEQTPEGAGNDSKAMDLIQLSINKISRIKESFVSNISNLRKITFRSLTSDPTNFIDIRSLRSDGAERQIEKLQNDKDLVLARDKSFEEVCVKLLKDITIDKYNFDNKTGRKDMGIKLFNYHTLKRRYDIENDSSLKQSSSFFINLSKDLIDALEKKGEVLKLKDGFISVYNDKLEKFEKSKEDLKEANSKIPKNPADILERESEDASRKFSEIKREVDDADSKIQRITFRITTKLDEIESAIRLFKQYFKEEFYITKYARETGNPLAPVANIDDLAVQNVGFLPRTDDEKRSLLKISNDPNLANRLRGATLIQNIYLALGGKRDDLKAMKEDILARNIEIKFKIEDIRENIKDVRKDKYFQILIDSSKKKEDILKYHEELKNIFMFFGNIYKIYNKTISICNRNIVKIRDNVAGFQNIENILGQNDFDTYRRAIKAYLGGAGIDEAANYNGIFKDDYDMVEVEKFVKTVDKDLENAKQEKINYPDNADLIRIFNNLTAIKLEISTLAQTARGKTEFYWDYNNKKYIFDRQQEIIDKIYNEKINSIDEKEVFFNGMFPDNVDEVILQKKKEEYEIAKFDTFSFKIKYEVTDKSIQKIDEYINNITIRNSDYSDYMGKSIYFKSSKCNFYDTLNVLVIDPNRAAADAAANAYNINTYFADKMDADNLKKISSVVYLATEPIITDILSMVSSAIPRMYVIKDDLDFYFNSCFEKLKIKVFQTCAAVHISYRAARLAAPADMDTFLKNNMRNSLMGDPPDEFLLDHVFSKEYYNFDEKDKMKYMLSSFANDLARPENIISKFVVEARTYITGNAGLQNILADARRAYAISADGESIAKAMRKIDAHNPEGRGDLETAKKYFKDIILDPINESVKDKAKEAPAALPPRDFALANYNKDAVYYLVMYYTILKIFEDTINKRYLRIIHILFNLLIEKKCFINKFEGIGENQRLETYLEPHKKRIIEFAKDIISNHYDVEIEDKYGSNFKYVLDRYPYSPTGAAHPRVIYSAQNDDSAGALKWGSNSKENISTVLMTNILDTENKTIVHKLYIDIKLDDQIKRELDNYGYEREVEYQNAFHDSAPAGTPAAEQKDYVLKAIFCRFLATNFFGISNIIEISQDDIYDDGKKDHEQIKIVGVTSFFENILDKFNRRMNHFDGDQLTIDIFNRISDNYPKEETPKNPDDDHHQISRNVSINNIFDTLEVYLSSKAKKQKDDKTQIDEAELRNIIETVSVAIRSFEQALGLNDQEMKDLVRKLSQADRTFINQMVNDLVLIPKILLDGYMFISKRDESPSERDYFLKKIKPSIRVEDLEVFKKHYDFLKNPNNDWKKYMTSKARYDIQRLLNQKYKDCKRIVTISLMKFNEIMEGARHDDRKTGDYSSKFESMFYVSADPVPLPKQLEHQIVKINTIKQEIMKGIRDPSKMDKKEFVQLFYDRYRNISSSDDSDSDSDSEEEIIVNPLEYIAARLAYFPQFQQPQLETQSPEPFKTKNELEKSFYEKSEISQHIKDLSGKPSFNKYLRDDDDSFELTDDHKSFESKTEHHKPQEHKPQEHKPQEHKPQEHKPQEHKPQEHKSFDKKNPNLKVILRDENSDEDDEKEDFKIIKNKKGKDLIKKRTN